MAVVGAPGPPPGEVAVMAPVSSMLAPPAVRLLGDSSGMVVAEVSVAPAVAVAAALAAWVTLVVAPPPVKAPPLAWPGRPTGVNVSGVTILGIVVVLAVLGRVVVRGIVAAG